MDQTRFNARDERYLHSTRFEVYLIVGSVFALGFTAAMIVSIFFHAEPWVWPGALLSVVLSVVLFQVLKKREYHEKLRELEADYAREANAGK